MHSAICNIDHPPQTNCPSIIGHFEMAILIIFRQKNHIVSFCNRGFNVMPYQANFASHYTRNRHVGFITPYGMV